MGVEDAGRLGITADVMIPRRRDRGSGSGRASCHSSSTDGGVGTRPNRREARRRWARRPRRLGRCWPHGPRRGRAFPDSAAS